MVYILVFLAIIVVFAFSMSSNKTRRELELRHSYYRLAHALDITKYEADSFVDDLSKQRAIEKSAELYRTAINELRARVTVPRSLSGDHRTLITIEPKVTHG